MNNRLLGISLALSAAALFACGDTFASPGMGTNLGLRSQAPKSVQGNQFRVPSELRGRVDFWKDIFAKYTSAQVVVHHRNFPQIRFGVLDFSTEKAAMNPVVFEKYKKAAEGEAVAAIKRQLIELSQGEDPSTPFQRDAVELLKDIPGGQEKYKTLVDEDLVRTQTGIRERYAEAIRRSWKYLPVMEQIFVSEFGLPKELTRIPFIESSFDYTAYSSVGAAGIWQFMPRTARSHKLLVGRYVDERRDPLRATRAAAEYLRGAYNSLGSWPLAITSYNHGIGGVRSKVNKAGTNDLAAIIEDPKERFFGFASTNFYPEFLAALEIYEDHERYFPEIPAQPPLRVYTVAMKGSVPVSQAAKQLGVPLDALKEANYALLEPVWRGTARIPAGYQLRVPVEYQNRAVNPSAAGSLAQTPQIVAVSQPAAQGTKHRVARGETLASIAKRYNTSPEKLKEINGLASLSVKSGQLLTVNGTEGVERAEPRAQYETAKRQLTGGMPSAIQQAEASELTGEEKKRYVVKAGDTLSAIAKKTGSSVDKIKRANKLKAGRVVVGQTLVIP